jgi:O-antigen ligase
MQVLETWARRLVYLFIFLLPLQTRWIYHLGILNGGAWEYGTFALYGTELILGLILIGAIILAVAKIRKQENKKAIKQESSDIIKQESSDIIKQESSEEIKQESKPAGGGCASGAKARKQKFRLVVFLFFCFLVLLFSALDPALAFYKLIQIILAVAFAFSFLIIKPNLKKAFLIIVASGVVQSLLAVYQFIVQQVFASKWLGMAAQNPNILGTPVVETPSGRILRVFGSFPHPNMLAGFLTICLLVILKLFFEEKIKLNRLWFLLAFGLNFLALILTGSRSAFIVFFVVAAAHLVLTKFFKKDWWKIGLALIIPVIIIAGWNFNFMNSRWNFAERLNVKSTNERIAGYQDALKIFQENWLLGVGAGNYTLALYQDNPNQSSYFYQPLHNALLLPLVEFGVAYFLLIAYLVYNFFKKIKKKIPVLTTFPCLLTTLPFLLGLLSLFDHYLYSFYFGLMLVALVVAIWLGDVRNRKSVSG